MKRALLLSVVFGTASLVAETVPGEYWVSPDGSADAAYTKESPGSYAGLGAARNARKEKGAGNLTVVFAPGTYSFAKLFPRMPEKAEAAIGLWANAGVTNRYRGATGRAEDVVFDGTGFPMRVLVMNGMGGANRVEGITFRNFRSNGRGFAADCGGSVAVGESKVHSAISNCVFEGNTALKDGGAVWGGVELRDCRFVGNTALEGCGGAVYGATREHAPLRMLAERCVFIDNTAPEYYRTRYDDTSIAGWCTLRDSKVESCHRDVFGRKKGPFVNTLRVKNSGELFAAVEKLRSERDAKGRTEIVLSDGFYTLTNAVRLCGRDSHLTVRAEHPGKAVLVNGFTLKGSDFRRAASVRSVLRRLPEAAKKSALVAKVPREYQKILGGHDRLQLSVDARAMTHARWPNVGGIITPKDVDEKVGVMKFSEPRFTNWAFDSAIGVFGMTGQYTSGGFRVTDHDVTNGTLTAKGVRPNRRVFFHGPVEEIDEPGEWAYAAADGMIVLWPDSSFRPASVIAVAASWSGFFDITGDDVHLEGLVFTSSFTGGGAVRIHGGSRGASVAGCSFSALRGDAVSADAFDCRVQSSDFIDIGGCGVRMTGGDKRRLVPGGNLVDNCLFERVCRMRDGFAIGAVKLDGVSNCVSHCVIHDTREHAMDWSGYDCVVEYCRMYDANLEFRDSAVVYSPGGPCSFGCHFRYNDISGSPGLSHGIYPDDMSSGHRIYGNVVRNVGWGGIFLGGGRNNVISNNVVVQAGSMALHNDNRGLFWPAWENREKWHRRTIDEYDYVDGPIGRRWPEFAHWHDDGELMFGNVDNDWVYNITIDTSPTDDQVCMDKPIPLTRQLSRDNLAVGLRHEPRAKAWRFGGFKPIDLRTTPNRLFKDVPPVESARRSDGLEVFVYRKGDFNLADDSVVKTELPGFTPIPWDKIGLYVDKWRKRVVEPEGLFSGQKTDGKSGDAKTAAEVVRVALSGKREVSVAVREAGVYFCWVKTAASGGTVNVAGRDFKVPSGSSGRWTKLGKVMMPAGFSAVTVKGTGAEAKSVLEVALTQSSDWKPGE